MEPQRIAQRFRDLFGPPDVVVRSPGRINLIGEHTDYNDGFVLPAAINRSIYLAMALTSRPESTVVATDLDDRIRFRTSNAQPVTRRWANYILGVVADLERQGHQIPAFNCIFGGDIPIGAGLSSSAALAVGTVFALNEVADLGLDRLQMARIAQAAEHNFAGVECGIMDQFANLFGKKNTPLLLDCRSLNYETCQLAADVQIILCNTGVSHALAATEYNLRRQQCRSAVASLRRHNREIHSLRDVTHAELLEFRDEMQPNTFERAVFILRENERVQQAARALHADNEERLGQLMFESHAGLRDDYQVSCSELDLLVEIALNSDAVLGARMMGGGFGGCTINLVWRTGCEDFMEQVRTHYRHNCEIYAVTLEDGTAVVA